MEVRASCSLSLSPSLLPPPARLDVKFGPSLRLGFGRSSPCLAILFIAAVCLGVAPTTTSRTPRCVCGRRSDAEGDAGLPAKLHVEVHKARENFEKVRHTMIQAHSSMSDLEEIFRTPKEMALAAQGFSKTAASIEFVLGKIGKSGGPLGTALANTARVVLKAVTKTTKLAHDKLELLDKKCKLTGKNSKEAGMKSKKDKFLKKAPFIKMQKINKRLVKLEAMTGNCYKKSKKSAVIGQSPYLQTPLCKCMPLTFQLPHLYLDQLVPQLRG